MTTTGRSSPKADRPVLQQLPDLGRPPVVQEARVMIINHQAHWYPPAYFEFVRDRPLGQYPRAELRASGRWFYDMGEGPGAWRYEISPHFVDLDEQFAAYDAAGVHGAAISPNMLAELDLLDLGEAKETASLLNEELAGAQRRYPGRVAGIAVLPWHDTEAALAELDHAARLDLRGVLMLSNVGGRPVAEPETWPIFERIDELGWPIFLHPSSNSMLHDRGLVPILDSTVGWVWETSAAALTLVLSGLLDRYRNLEIVHHHLGGVIPFTVGRLARYARSFPVELEHPVQEYLRTRFYIDSKTDTPGAAELAAAIYGADRIVYGDDYPWHPSVEHQAFLAETFPADLAEQVLHRNRVRSLRFDG